MQKHLQKLLLLVAMFVVPWVTQGQSFSYSCDFEGSNDTAGWVFVNGSQTNKWFIGSAVHNGGSNSLYISNDNGTTNAYSTGSITFAYAYQEFALDAGSYEISYDWRTQGESNYDYIRVFLAPATFTLTAGQNTLGTTSANTWASAALPAGFVSLTGSVKKLNLQSTWQHFSEEITVPTAGTYRLVFAWANDASGGTQPPAAIDNIVFSQPTCARPYNVHFAAVSPNAFDIVWQESGNATSWLVQVDSAGTTVLNATAYDTLYNFTGCYPNSTYTVRVASLCDGTDTSSWSAVTVRTPCAYLDSLPFVENFEACATGGSTNASFANCWYRLNNGTTYFGYPYVSGTTTYNHTPGGSKGLYWMSSITATTYGDYQCIVLPGVDTTVNPINTLQLSFWARSSSASTHPVFLVGVMTDPNDINSFQQVGVANVEGTTFAEYEVPMSAFAGHGAYVAIKAVRPTASWTAYVDDITLELLPACPMVVGLHVDTVTTSEVTLAWSPAGNASQWLVRYMSGDAWTEQIAYDTTITITGLSASTNYTFEVSGLCGSDTSEAADLSVYTACGELTELPFVQDFESATTGGSTNASFVQCWTRLNNGTTYFGYPYVSGTSTYNHTPGGSKGLYWMSSITANTYGDYQCIVLPAIDTTMYPINTLQLSFWARSSSTTTHPVFLVGVMTNPNDINSFQQVGVVNVEGTTFAEYEVPMSAFAGHGAYVAIKAVRPTASWTAYVDDITLDLLPACPRVVGLQVDTVTTSDITVSWSPAGNASQWLVRYTSDNVWTEQIAYDTTITVTGLSASTGYTFEVRGLCDSDTSEAARLTVYTACGLLTELPYIQDFENEVTGGSTNASFVQCWTRLNNGTTYFGYPYVSATASYNHTEGGTKSLYWLNSTTAGTYGDYQCVVLPAVDTNVFPVNTLQLTFWAKSTSATSNPQFLVGVMTNPDSINTFQVVDTVDVVGTNHEEYMVTFADFAGYGAHVAIKAVRPTASRTAVMDDIQLGLMPSCPRVSDLVQIGATTSSITLSWTEEGDATMWVVEYDTVDFTPGTDAAVTEYATAMPHTLSNLDSAQSYYIYLRPDCGSTGEEMYRSIVGRTLEASPATLPYACDFEDDGNNGWTLVNGTQTNAWYVDSAVNNGGSRSMYISNDNGTSNAYTTTSISYVYAMRTFDFSDAGEYAYSYDWRSKGESHSYDYVRVFLAPVSYQWNAGTCPAANTYAFASWAIPTGWIELTEVYGSPRTLANSTVWRTATGTFTLINPGTYNMVFAWANDGSGGTQPPAAIDNILLEQYTCPTPVLRVEGTSIDSVMLAWHPLGNESTWVVGYDSVEYVVNDTVYAFSGLNSNTEYHFYVRAVCGEGDTSMTDQVAARTNCGAITALPFIEGFEGLPVGNSTDVPPSCGVPCWYRIDNASQYHFGYVGNPSSFPTGAHTGSGFLYYYMPTTATTYADWIITALPQIDQTVLPMNTLQVSFWAKMNTTTMQGNIEVGVMTDPTADSTFVPVDTVQVIGSTYEQKVVYLSNYTGSGEYIALRFSRQSATTYYFIDDVVVDLIPACPPVDNLVLSGLDSNMLQLTWTEVGTATSWTVEYGPTGFTPGTGTSVTATAVPFTITGLAANTEYDVYVAPVCSGGAAGTAYGTFRTAGVCVSLPFVCNFEDSVQNSKWILENGSLTNKWHIGTATQNGGSKSLYISNDNGVSNAYTITSTTMVFAYVDMMLDNPGDYVYSYDWKCNGESTFDYLRVALVPASTTLAPGTSVVSGFSSTALPSGWIAVDGGSKLNLQSNWQTYSGMASVTSAGVYHLVFAFRCDGSAGSMPPPAIDNIEFSRMTCASPTGITVSNLTPVSADIAWNGGTATAWEYQLGSGSITATTSTNVALTGLTANTPYTFKVRTICSSSDTSVWTSCSFRTPCSYITTLPYTQDFETESTSTSTTNSNFVNCWFRLNNGTTSGGYPYVSGTASYNHTTGGTKSLYWYNSTTMTTFGDYVGAVLPPVDSTISISDLRLRFWAKMSTATATSMFQIGVMTNPSDVTTFVGIDTIAVSGTTWQQVEVSMSGYAGNGQYVAVKTDRGTVSNTAYVDDFILDYTPTCYSPIDITSIGETTSSITVDWTDRSAASVWQIEYGPAGFTQGTAAGNTVTVYAHPHTVGGLVTNTNYDFYVRSICSVGDSSEWAGPAVLSTGFCDNAVDVSIGSESSSSSSYLAPVNNYYKYTLSQTIVDSAEIGGAMDIEYISYYYDYATPMTDKTNCTIYLQPTTLSVFASNTAVVPLDTNTAVRVYTGALNCNQGWNTFAFDTVYSYDGTGNLLVIIDDNSNAYDGSAYVFKTAPCTGNKTLYYYSDTYDPDVTNPSTFTGSKGVANWRPIMRLTSCSGSLCPQPVITSETHDYHAATITWSGSGSAYEVNIKEAASINWPATDIAVSGNSHTFTGLQPETTYTYRVRQDCAADGNGYSDWTVGTFTTDSLPCLPPTDLAVSDVTNSHATFSWQTIGNESQWDLHVWYSGGLDSVYRVSSNPVTVGGFTAGVTYNAAIRAICGTEEFEGDYSTPITFTTQTCPDVTGLSTSNVTATSVTVNWTADPMAESWLIEYGFSGFAQGAGTSATATTNSFTAVGLEDETSYDFYVKAVCGSDWTSEGWKRINATTLVHSGVTYTVTVNVNDAAMGSVTGAGTYNEGTTCTLTATPNAGYRFVDWGNGTSDNPYSFVVTSDVTLTATFAATQGIEDVEGGVSCAIYPNPATDAATISVRGANGKVRITVVDMNGREVAGEVLECSADCEKSLDVDGLAQGAYFVRITGDAVNMVKKLIVR